MNPHLQNILTIVQQDEKLSAEQKEAIAKSIKSADKELEITAFKLDRTEKVKRTTAILLEETIEELEQKRKAVEAQNRELEIESSLERIRAKVTAMRVSTDLLDIVVTMRTEFVALGHEAHYFWHMRWLPDKYEKAMTSGDGSRIGHVMTLPRHIHGEVPLIDTWEKGKEPTVVYPMDADAAVDYVIKMIELGDFEHVDPNSPTLDDLSAIGGLTFIMARTTHGEIGFSLPGLVPAPPVESIDALIRFAAVFDLAYRRFEDLKSSEKQIREGQIELALERVRARTMAMQHSDELADSSFVLDSQVRSLGIRTVGCAFNIYGENESSEWFSSERGALPRYTTPRENLFLRYYEAGQRGEKIHIEEFAGEDCVKHYEYLCTIPIMGDALRGMLEAVGSFPERQVDHVVYFKYGYVLFITAESAPEAHEIFIRFTKVFEQTYTRFLDLQKAEEQTLQAEQDLIEIKTARKKAEETLLELQATQNQLIQSEKMASLGELTAGIAHEIQNPLNFVNNFSEVSKELLDEMKTELDLGNIADAKEIANDVMQNLEKINHHGKRADGIVKGMLQHSRSSSGQKELTDINALEEEYIRLCYHGLRAKDKSFNATIRTEFDPGVGTINVLPQDLGRVILNLLTNAFYAVNEKKKQLAGGDKESRYEPTVTLTTKKTAGKTQVIVADNGNGIPDKVVEKIFQPFFTTKPTGQGTGLGLSLSYDIITKGHGGDLQVETKENEGSKFVIQLPV
jgi:signal transduction histidine kinase